jgi:L-histidine N-alpha-methyltransferase
VAFLGGTIGNFAPQARAEFLRAVAHGLEPGEGLLLGTDLVKSADRLIAAYDDSEGITEEFIRNALVVIDRELGATFDPAAFTYVPFWDAREQRMDLRLRSTRRQHVRVPGADLEFDLADGEELHVEISTKFMVDGVRAELDAAASVEVFTDGAPGLCPRPARHSRGPFGGTNGVVPRPPRSPHARDRTPRRPVGR